MSENMWYLIFWAWLISLIFLKKEFHVREQQRGGYLGTSKTSVAIQMTSHGLCLLYSCREPNKISENLKNIQSWFQGGRWSSLVQQLPSMCKTLGLIPNTEKKRQLKVIFFFFFFFFLVALLSFELRALCRHCTTWATITAPRYFKLEQVSVLIEPMTKAWGWLYKPYRPTLFPYQDKERGWRSAAGCTEVL
jgi:hypothetical protein